MYSHGLKSNDDVECSVVSKIRNSNHILPSFFSSESKVILLTIIIYNQIQTYIFGFIFCFAGSKASQLNSSKSIVLLWISWHDVDIKGNKGADKLAKKALELEPSKVNKKLPVLILQTSN